MKLKIISGGQTGVDQAALRAAKALGIETGGTMPRGWLTENGSRPEFAELYGMSEAGVHGYPYRTEKNVEDADVTLWCGQTGSRGFGVTKRAADKFGKPICVIEIINWSKAFMISGLWLSTPRTSLVINVAGSRESRNPGIGERAERGLSRLFHVLLNDINKKEAVSDGE